LKSIVDRTTLAWIGLRSEAFHAAADVRGESPDLERERAESTGALVVALAAACGRPEDR
jgi:hypothetical protein